MNIVQGFNENSKINKELRKNKIYSYIIRILPMFSIPFVNILYPILNTRKGNVSACELIIGLDNMIPFEPVFIVPYVLWYGYVVFTLFYFCFKDFENYKKMLISMNLGLLTCFFIYFIFPTTVTRPAIEGKGWAIYLLKIIYSSDKPYNCFPSIHVLQVAIVMIYFHITKQSNLFIRVFINVIGIFIILSTMFIKQHYILDMISGIILAFAVYYAAKIIYKLIQDNKKKCRS